MARRGELLGEDDGRMLQKDLEGSNCSQRHKCLTHWLQKARQGIDWKQDVVPEDAAD